MSETEYTLTIDGENGGAKCSVTITGYGTGEEAAAALATESKRAIESVFPDDRVHE